MANKEYVEMKAAKVALEEKYAKLEKKIEVMEKAKNEPNKEIVKDEMKKIDINEVYDSYRKICLRTTKLRNWSFRAKG